MTTFTLHIYDLDFISRGRDDCVGVLGEKADKTVNTVWNNVFCGNKNGSFGPGSFGISSCICGGRYKWKLLLWIKCFSFMQYVFPLMHNLPFCLTWCDPASISTLCSQEFEWSYLELFFWSKAHGTQGLMYLDGSPTSTQASLLSPYHCDLTWTFVFLFYVFLYKCIFDGIPVNDVSIWIICNTGIGLFCKKKQVNEK